MDPQERRGTLVRLSVLAVLFVATAGLVRMSLRPESVPLRQPLQTLPLHMAHWDGQDAPPLADDIVATLGVDEYVNRVYAAAGGPIGLYVGYYESQRQGDSIHSPLNCLPGAGWEPLKRDHLATTVDGRTAPIEVNRLLIQKGLDQQVVFYWYMSHGRVVASEYVSKFYLIGDAVRFNRSDAALVRVLSPVLPSADGEAAAERRAVAFVRALFPALDAVLPS